MKRGLLVVLTWGLAAAALGAGPRPFLFLKTGEKFATQEAAGPTVGALTDYLGAKLGGATNAFAPQVLNDPVKAAEFAAAQKPLLGIVTPGFYLTYAKTLGLEPLLETRREKVEAERYVLVGRKDAPDQLDAFAGKTIATGLAAEQRYVMAVILRNKLGEEVRLAATTDSESAVFDLAEAAPKAAAAVLLEEAAWKAFADDPELGAKLKVLYRSDELPHDLVVVFRPNAAELAVDKVPVVLKAMSGDEAGQKILRSIRVVEFTDVNQERLTKARELFHGK